MGRPPKVMPPRRPNPISRIKPIRNPTPVLHNPTSLARKAAETAAAAGASKAKPRLCPNKECSNPQIEDGICHNCGTIIDDSNIVAEVQFGESSSGAAVVQGSFISAESGTAKSLGPAFRKAGGSEDRESTIREGKRIMNSLASQMTVPEPVINSATQIFKLCAMNNFIQGRRMDMVAAVCLYTACRKEKPCKVMLIDFADRLQVNVFKLGHVFKALHKTISLARDGIQPVLPEDLIYRFATKLEFGTKTSKVAEDAVRMVQRMSLDWMVMGRRPSGVCGACLIMAARMNNFRRTVTEVVYIVKVTTHTIQKRLDEFKLTPSSSLTIEEFLNNEFLESAHDPPSFYRKSEEFLKNKKTRKRKRPTELGEDESTEVVDGGTAAEGGDASQSVEGDGQNKRPRMASRSPPSEQPTLGLRVDADGFAIPPPPSHPEIPIDPLLTREVQEIIQITEDQLVEEYGDVSAQGNENSDSDSPATGSSPSKGQKSNDNGYSGINVPPAWESSEQQLESEISEMINDPNSELHAIQYARAAKRTQINMLIAAARHPQKAVSDDVHIGEDEFADDPEVVNCLLPEEEMLKKEKIWVNENKGWLRMEQLKLYKKKMEESGPPKATRKRKKKARIGEGQTSAASTPGEAAVSVLKDRTWSKKINYDAVRKMFDDDDGKRGPGSAATSRMTSRAGSTAPSVTPSAAASDVTSLAAGTEDVAESEVGNALMSELGDYDDEDMDMDMEDVNQDMNEMFGDVDDDDDD